MLGKRHARKTRHGFALASGRHHQNLGVIIVIDGVHIDEPFVGDMQFSDLHGHTADIDHAASDKAYPPSVADTVVNHHLHAVNVGGKHGDNHAPLGLPEHGIEGLADLELAHRKAGALHVGALAQQRKHTLLTVGSQCLEVHDLPINGRIVHLEVARTDHCALRTGNRNGTGPCNGVTHMNKLAGKFAQLHNLSWPYRLHMHIVDTMFLQLHIDQGQCELGAVERCLHLMKHIGDGADMILVAMGEKKTADILLLGHKVADIRDDQIHAEHIFLGEDASAVHHHDIVLVLEDIHVLTDFVHAAQGNNPQLAGTFIHTSLSHREPPFASGCAE